MLPSKYIRYCLLICLGSIGFIGTTFAFLPAGISAGIETLTAKTCQTRNCNSSFFTKLCGPCQTDTSAQPSVQGSPYPQEWNDAYIWAYSLGITTKSTIKDAAMDEPLVRKYAAQMISEFAVKVLGLKPDITKKCDFEDIKNESQDLQYYILLSCQLGIMGLDYYGTPDVVFNPNYVVRRDQFITMISRMLRGTEYNITTGELTINDKMRNFGNRTRGKVLDLFGIQHTFQAKIDRYTKHLDAVKKLSVIKEYTLSIKEVRGYVMIILKRILDRNLIE